MLDISGQTETITDINMVRYLMNDAEVRVAVMLDGDNALLCDRHHFSEWAESAGSMPEVRDGVTTQFEFHPVAKVIIIGGIYG